MANQTATITAVLIGDSHDDSTNVTVSTNDSRAGMDIETTVVEWSYETSFEFWVHGVLICSIGLLGLLGISRSQEIMLAL